MSSPFAPTASSPGHGNIRINLIPPSRPNLCSLNFAYPLKLISPTPTSNSRCILVFLLTYGGGLVAGDSIHLTIDIAAQSKLALVTQGSTKLFRAPAPSVVSSQTLEVRIESNGALLYLPDPVQPFAGSAYRQTQIFHLCHERGSLCMLDWLSEGRTSRGEKWAFSSWRGLNEVWSLPRTTTDKKRLLLRDNVILDSTETRGAYISIADRMDHLGVFGTLLICGPIFHQLGQFFLDEFKALPRIGAPNWSNSTDDSHLSDAERARASRCRKADNDGLLWTAASVRGFVVVKFGAREVEGAREWLKVMIQLEGSVEAEFGEGALLCLK